MLAEFAKVREGRPADAEALAKLFRESWLLAYQGIIPQAHLNAMIARRAPAWWRSGLARRGGSIILDVKGVVAGYATYGASRWPGRQQAEIYELYLTPVYQGLGLGERLFESARQRIDAMRLDGLIVWALSDNSAACDFYRRRGGRVLARRSEQFGGTTLPKTAFGWD